MTLPKTRLPRVKTHIEIFVFGAAETSFGVAETQEVVHQTRVVFQQFLRLFLIVIPVSYLRTVAIVVVTVELASK